MKRESLTAALFILLALGLSAAAAQGCCAPILIPPARSTQVPPSGERGVLNTQVSLTYGKTLTLDTYRGQPLVLAVFSTTCPSCVSELKALARLQAAGTKVLLVSGQDTLPDLVRFAQNQRLPFPVGRVAPQFIAQLKILAYPTVVVLDARGRAVTRQQGTADVQSLQNTLAGLRTTQGR
ncbi:TlpA disulfide reductase family protein [Deinococcus sp. YIM 77859]|uniref:TlpA family protein disulfide reductase n=1 Tax=Deinococcus sp. YIM 77859 TaxID=1540221 RepID=UPI000554D417|nr:TlpA disulfide reductase family protein [Deinococcus sp. YIM 77859]